MSPGRGLLRRRQEHQHHRVDSVELFFDLVFVFAVTQISHSLIEHFSLIGAVQTIILTVAVWWVWIYTVWVTNWLDPATLPVRLAVLMLMLPGLILSSSIPKAFDTHGIWFAGAYVSMQIGRTLFFIWAVQGHPGMVRVFQRILTWFVLGAIFWIAGAFAESPTRLALWALALAVELVSPMVGLWVPGLGKSTTAEWDIEGGHMAERCGLFMIIALGESLLMTGATFSELPWTVATVAAMTVALAGSLVMWWLYFDTTAEIGSRAISHSRDPGRLARSAYTYVHLLLVSGVILSAVADEFVVAHPLGHTDSRTTIAVLGGTALFILGAGLFKWTILGRLPVPTLVVTAALGALVPLAVHVAPIGLMAAALAVMIGAAVWGARARHVRLEPR
jgi:low temperature requirement protein LtrA